VCFWWWVGFYKAKERCQNLDHLAHHMKLHTLKLWVKITMDQRLRMGLHSMFHVMNKGKAATNASNNNQKSLDWFKMHWFTTCNKVSIIILVVAQV
jgi:hypothetical protein